MKSREAQKLGLVLSVFLTACGTQASRPEARAQADMLAQQACQNLTPASQGGPMPRGDVVTLRWLGTSNFEVAYRGTVVILDTFYDRPARTAALGFAVKDVTRADIILIGHAHADHISDIAAVAEQTKAPVVGSAISVEEAVALGVPESQTRTVAGDQVLSVGDISIRPTHIVHSSIEPGLIPALNTLYQVDAPSLTSEQKAQASAVMSRGSRDSRVITEGTLGFTLSFPHGFKIVWFDSVGDPTPEERQLAAKIAPVDVAIFPWTPHPISETQLAYTFPHLQLFRPALYVPDHHDAIWGVWLDNGLAPLFMKIRDELPATKFIDPLYRTPICFDTQTAARRSPTGH